MARCIASPLPCHSTCALSSRPASSTANWNLFSIFLAIGPPRSASCKLHATCLNRVAVPSLTKCHLSWLSKPCKAIGRPIPAIELISADNSLPLIGFVRYKIAVKSTCECVISGKLTGICRVFSYKAACTIGSGCTFTSNSTAWCSWFNAASISSWDSWWVAYSASANSVNGCDADCCVSKACVSAIGAAVSLASGAIGVVLLVFSVGALCSKCLAFSVTSASSLSIM